MPKLENLTENLKRAQSIDFVETFGNSIKTLKDLLMIERTLVLPIGSTIKTYKSKVTLVDGKVEKGDIIPLSKVDVIPDKSFELTYRKHRKAVSVEDIQTYGFTQAITNTDQKLIRELQKEVRGDLFAQLKTGTGVTKGVGLQGALAQAWGGVQVAFEDDGVTTVAFVNPLDVADYLAKASITVQTAFGLNYVEDFLGAKVAILSSQIDKGTLYATAPENLILAYAKVDGGEIGKAFDFVTDETGIIGVTHDIDKKRLTSETTTLSSGVLFAERLDGVIKSTIEAAVTA